MDKTEINEIFQAGVRAHDQKNYPEALAQFTRAAELGNSAAAFNLGLMYKNGEGTEKDRNQALMWARKAAEQGVAKADVLVERLERTISEQVSPELEPIQKKMADDLNYAGTMAYAERHYTEAIEKFTDAVGFGSADAAYHLAQMYQNGEGVERDYVEALKWAEKAADLGYPEIEALIDALNEQKKYAGEMVQYTKAAEQGDPLAAHNLGMMHESGKGTAEDKAEALKWYEKAADLGSSAEEECTENLKRQIAFEAGGRALKEKNYPEALAQYTRAAEWGHLAAQFNVGLMYDYGKGTAEDKAKALFWYEKAAEQGDADAQYCCAKMYYNGEGTEKDSRVYLMWLRKAAAQGHTEAAEVWDRMMSLDEGDKLLASAILEEGKRAFAKERYEEAMQRLLEVPEPHRMSADYILGLMFEEGLGTQADRNKAIRCYEKAAKQGHAEAAFQLGKIYDKIYSEEAGINAKKEAGQIDSAEAWQAYMNAFEGPQEVLAKTLMWFEKAAEQGHEKAQIRCGMMYFRGRGTAKNYEKALMWLEKAEAQGSTEAHFAIKGVRGTIAKEAEARKTADRKKKGLFGLF